MLRDVVNRFVFVYLDDILIFSPERAWPHPARQASVTAASRESLIRQAGEVWVSRTISSVPGVILSPEGIRMDPAKVEAVANWPTPEDRKAVQRFLGFANFYRRFIRGFSQIALPLTNLTSTRRRFCWSEQALEAFEKLKSRFVSAPILINPDPSRQFIVEVECVGGGSWSYFVSEITFRQQGTPLRFFFSHRLTPSNGTTILGIRSCWRSSWAWRSGVTGWRVRGFLFWFGPTIKNLEYIRSAKRNKFSAGPLGSILWAFLISPSPIAQGVRTVSRTHSRGFLKWNLDSLLWCPSCHPAGWLRWSLGRWNPGSVRHLTASPSREVPRGSVICTGVGSNQHPSVGPFLWASLPSRSGSDTCAD